jgi:competence protein ComEC
VISHPHPDHYLGLAALRVPVGELWSAEDAAPSALPAARNATPPTFAQIAAALAAGGTRLTHPPLGIARREAGVELEILGPAFRRSNDAPAIEAVDPVRSVNDNSLVVAIHYAGRTILLPGDIEAEGEEQLIASGLSHVDAVAVPHHGSPTSSTPVFVAATTPELAVISCGPANHFGFPGPDVVARWVTAGARVERTDLAGAITMTISSSGIVEVSPFRPR